MIVNSVIRHCAHGTRRAAANDASSICGGKMIAQILIIALCIDAAYVAAGLARGRNMWRFIVLYWCLLTAKNLADFGGV